MVIMIWRGLTISTGYLGEASLGYGADYWVEGGTKRIKAKFGLNNGSGFTAQDWGERDEKINFHTLIHEFAHWLLGASHPYGGDDEHGYWGMLHHSADGICANAYERERVGWITPTVITSDLTSASLSDYLSNGVTYKYHPTNGATNEYYYFENHQKLNIYDDATTNSSDKGILVLHFKNSYDNTNSSRCKVADGQWNWTTTGTSSCFGGSNNVRKWKMSSVNRAGNNRRDKLSNSGSWDWIWYIENEQCAGYVYGANSNNAFNLTYNNVFSPASNPYSATWNNVAENFTMEVVSQNSSTLNARFYLTNPYDGKPSKPQNLKVVSNGTNPVVSWDANTETDLSKYWLYRSDDGGSFYRVAIINKPTTSYTDLGVAFTKPIWEVRIEYKVIAVDNSNNQSVFSNMAYIYGDPNILPKEAEDLEAENISEDILPEEYSLQQNYPNPFNPTTTISYDIPKNNQVSLKVYNSLGKEVSELVNGFKQAGSYSVTFDASNLPSGVYFYKIQAGEYNQVNKMILLK